MHPGHLVLQGLKGRFHFCHHTAFDHTFGDQSLRVLNGNGWLNLIVDHDAGNIGDKDKIGAKGTGGQSSGSAVRIDIVALAFFIGGYRRNNRYLSIF